MDNELRELFRSKLNNIVLAESSGGKARQKIWFTLNGNKIEGNCASELSAGECLALRTNTGEWWLFAVNNVVKSQVNARSVIYSRTSVREKEIYKVKVLFAVETSTEIKYYIAGDRSAPTQLIALPTNSFIGYTKLTNTGKDPSNFIATIRSDSSISKIWNILGKKIYNFNRNAQSIRFMYADYGFWSTSFKDGFYYINQTEELKIDGTLVTSGNPTASNSSYSSSEVGKTYIPSGENSRENYTNYYYRQTTSSSIADEERKVVSKSLLLRGKNSYIVESLNFSTKRSSPPSVERTYTYHSGDRIINLDTTKTVSLWADPQIILTENTKSFAFEASVRFLYERDFSVSSSLEDDYRRYYLSWVGQDVLVAQKKAFKKYLLLKGKITDFTMSSSFGNERIKFNISVVATSFTPYLSLEDNALSVSEDSIVNTAQLIADNGSFYSFCLRNYGSLNSTSRSVMLADSGLFSLGVNYLEKGNYSEIAVFVQLAFRNVNLVGNKIYVSHIARDVSSKKDTVLVEIWIIDGTGKLRRQDKVMEFPVSGLPAVGTRGLSISNGSYFP